MEPIENDYTVVSLSGELCIQNAKKHHNTLTKQGAGSRQGHSSGPGGRDRLRHGRHSTASCSYQLTWRAQCRLQIDQCA